LDTVFSPFNAKFSSKPITLEELQKHVEDLSVSLGNMHKAVSESVSSKRAAERKRRLIKSHKVNFGLGDFVLVAIPKQKIRNKMQVKWSGPFRIIEVINDLIFKVETLDSSKTEIIHAQRLRFYCEKDFLSEEFMTYEIDPQEKFEISELLDIRSSTSGFEVLVRWLGFETSDDSWEPLQQIYEDIPLILHDFLIQKGKEDIWRNLILNH
jgi:hypothetical protein